jgi:hypothetical protein
MISIFVRAAMPVFGQRVFCGGRHASRDRGQAFEPHRLF